MPLEKASCSAFLFVGIHCTHAFQTCPPPSIVVNLSLTQTLLRDPEIQSGRVVHSEEQGEDAALITKQVPHLDPTKVQQQRRTEVEREREGERGGGMREKRGGREKEGRSNMVWLGKVALQHLQATYTPLITQH